jgi:hypothetical protein
MCIERPCWWYEPELENQDGFTAEEYARLIEEQDAIAEEEMYAKFAAGSFG